MFQEISMTKKSYLVMQLLTCMGINVLLDIMHSTTILMITSLSSFFEYYYYYFFFFAT